MLKVRFFVFSLFLIQAISCAEEFSSMLVNTFQWPASLKVPNNLYQAVHLLESFKMLFPLVFTESKRAVGMAQKKILTTNPASGPYTEKHLEALFTIDGMGRQNEPDFDASTGLFVSTMTGLKQALSVEKIQWKYLPCRAGVEIDGRPEGFEMCWLNALVNAARFYDQSLLEEESVLNDFQWQNLVKAIFDCISEFGTIAGTKPSTRYQSIVKALNEKFNTKDRFTSGALVAALFQRREKLILSQTIDPLLNQYIRAIVTLLGQCVQIPEVRFFSPALLDPALPPTIFMSDFKSESLCQGLQMRTPVLRIDPSQAISKEQWIKFISGKLPLVFLFSIAHNFVPKYPGYKCKFHLDRPEDPHVVAIRMTIKDKILYLEVIDSFIHDPLVQPSFVPGVLMVLKEFSQYAKNNGSGLWQEAALTSYSKDFKILAKLHDKFFPFENEQLKKLKGELEKEHKKWNTPPDNVDYAKGQYEAFIVFLKTAFEIFPSQSDHTYASGFFHQFDNSSKLPGGITWKTIAPIFDMGLYAKEDSSFIEQVFRWEDVTESEDSLKTLSSIQLEFILNNFIINLVHGDHEFYSKEFLKTCIKCQDMFKNAQKNDQSRFAQWLKRKNPEESKAVAKLLSWSKYWKISEFILYSVGLMAGVFKVIGYINQKVRSNRFFKSAK